MASSTSGARRDGAATWVPAETVDRILRLVDACPDDADDPAEASERGDVEPQAGTAAPFALLARGSARLVSAEPKDQSIFIDVIHSAVSGDGRLWRHTAGMVVEKAWPYASNETLLRQWARLRGRERAWSVASERTEAPPPPRNASGHAAAAWRRACGWTRRWWHAARALLWTSRPPGVVGSASMRMASARCGPCCRSRRLRAAAAACNRGHCSTRASGTTVREWARRRRARALRAAEGGHPAGAGACVAEVLAGLSAPSSDGGPAATTSAGRSAARGSECSMTTASRRARRACSRRGGRRRRRRAIG